MAISSIPELYTSGAVCCGNASTIWRPEETFHRWELRIGGRKRQVSHSFFLLHIPDGHTLSLSRDLRLRVSNRATIRGERGDTGSGLRITQAPICSPIKDAVDEQFSWRNIGSFCTIG